MAETKRIMLSLLPLRRASVVLVLGSLLAAGFLCSIDSKRRVRRSFCKPLEKVHAITMLSGVNGAACKGCDFTDMRVR